MLEANCKAGNPNTQGQDPCQHGLPEGIQETPVIAQVIGSIRQKCSSIIMIKEELESKLVGVLVPRETSPQQDPQQGPQQDSQQDPKKMDVLVGLSPIFEELYNIDHILNDIRYDLESIPARLEI